MLSTRKDGQNIPKKYNMTLGNGTYRLRRNIAFAMEKREGHTSRAFGDLYPIRMGNDMKSDSDLFIERYEVVVYLPPLFTQFNFRQMSRPIYEESQRRNYGSRSVISEARHSKSNLLTVNILKRWTKCE